MDQFKQKLRDILHELDLPCFVLCALLDDDNRKPATGMMIFLQSLLKETHGHSIDLRNSFFVGDAAGRSHGPKDKDHSDCDKAFANALGISFHTPEPFFNIKRNNQLKLHFDP